MTRRPRRAAAGAACATALALGLLFGPSAFTADRVGEQTRGRALTILAGTSGFTLDLGRATEARAPDGRTATCAPVVRGERGWLCVAGDEVADALAWLTARPGAPVRRTIYRPPAGS